MQTYGRGAAKQKVPTKFRIVVDGKDSISEGVSNMAVARLKARGVPYSDTDHEKWDDEMEKEWARLEKFVTRFVKDGSGGSDSVTLELDLEAKTCVIVPVRKSRKPP